MEADKTLYYTDGHQVTITDSGFKVKNTLYRLNGITRHGFSIIYPARIPCTLLMVTGILLFVCGAWNLVPRAWNAQVYILGFSLLINSVLMITGIILLVIGLLIFLKLREKYAVRIFTAEGEKNVVVSTSREYISQIVDALNRAYMDLVKRGKK